MNRTLGNGVGEVANLQGVPGLIAEMIVTGGLLELDGECYIGEGDLPGKLTLRSNSTGQIGRVSIDGYFYQHEAGILHLELNAGNPALLLANDFAPRIDGILELTLADGYVPQDGDIIPLVTSEFIEIASAQFSMILINDPLPEGLYIKLNYIETDLLRDAGGTIYAEVDVLTNLFGYGDPNSATVGGTATDLVVADIGSGTRTADGFEDIIVTTTDSLIVFLSDGNGGIASQVTYNDATFTSLSSIDAGDLDGDGTIDLVVANSSTNEFIPIFNETNEATQLVIASPVTTGELPVDILVMNIDGDIDDDVIVACYGTTFTNGSIDFFTSTPSFASNFGSHGTVAISGNPKAVDPVDVNDDKDLDIFITLANANAVGKVANTPGVAGFNWFLESTTNVAIGPANIKSSDLNGDGFSDAVVACPESDVLCVLRGELDGSLASVLSLPVGDEPSSLALLDFDNDGDDDIAIIASNAIGNRVIALYRNDTSLNGGNLMFAIDLTIDEGLNPILVANGDIDGDLIDDLVSINTATSFRGTGTNELKLRKPFNACPADFDGNGVVGVDDLLQLIGVWQQTGPRPQDINSDGIVNIDDLLLLIGAWGSC